MSTPAVLPPHAHQFGPSPMQRPPTDLPPPADKIIPDPGLPRNNRAISRENPKGTESSPPNATPLQQHLLWFDFDGDGSIYPWDTYNGFRKLGFGWITSNLAAVVIHGTFSLPTQGWLLSPLMPINLNKAHRTKHGSDSEVYNTAGHFVPAKFEEIFTKYDRENKGGLNWNDIQDMVYTNMNVMDPTGWVAERLEWYTLFWLARDENGLLSKEVVRAMFDGSLWEKIAADVERKRKTTTTAQRVKHELKSDAQFAKEKLKGK